MGAIYIYFYKICTYSNHIAIYCRCLLCLTNYSLEILFVVRKILLHFPHVNSHFSMKWPKICAENNAVSTSQRVPLVHMKSCNTRVAIQYPNSFKSASAVHTSNPTVDYDPAEAYSMCNLLLYQHQFWCLGNTYQL